MSAKIMGRAWDLDLPHNQLLVLLALADHADHDGNNVYPSLGLVAWKTGYSEQQVRRVIRDLVKLKILVVVEKNPGRTIKYKVVIDAGIMKAAYTPAKMIPLTKSNPLHSDTTDPLQNVTPTPDMPSAKNDAEPSLEPSLEPNTPAAKALGRKPEPYYDAIATTFKLTAPGQIVCIRSMMQGKAIRGTWKDCNFDPPVTDPQEIVKFGDYMETRKREKHITEPITAAATIQRWFYDYRAAALKAAQPLQWSDIPELRGITEIIR